VPYPAIVLAAALIGALLATVPAAPETPSAPRPGRLAATIGTVAVWGAVWWLPVIAAALLLGPSHVLTEIGLFFSQLAMLTFGGAYALLVWLAQAAVEQKGWVTAAEMVDGLGLAETKPGPTILVTQFVGFLAAYRLPEPFSPMVAAVLGAAMTTWVTFAPSFLWIFAGAPYVEILRANRRISAALAAISATVVGVVAYVAFWFGLHVLFASVGEGQLGPLRYLAVGPASVRPDALALSVVAFVMLLVLHRGLMTTVAVMTGLGIAVRMVF
jgi:chromate transporter